METGVTGGHEAPTGIPSNGSIQIGAILISESSNRTVSVFPVCQNASEYQLYESGAYSEDAADWTALERSATYTFSSDGAKTLYCAFRNPARYTIGDPGDPDYGPDSDDPISATITISTDWQHSIFYALLDQIVAILRADTTLQSRDDDWDTSGDDAHVLKDWRHEEPHALSHGNLGRCPFCEVRVGAIPGPELTQGLFSFVVPYQIRAYLLKETMDVTNEEDTTSLVSSNAGMLEFLWDIFDALNSYPRLGFRQVTLHQPSLMDPTLLDAGAYRVGQLDIDVTVQTVLQSR
jgi:hypothetical protein